MLMGNLCVCLSGGMTRHVGVRKSLLDNCGKQPPPPPATMTIAQAVDKEGLERRVEIMHMPTFSLLYRLPPIISTSEISSSRTYIFTIEIPPSLPTFGQFLCWNYFKKILPHVIHPFKKFIWEPVIHSIPLGTHVAKWVLSWFYLCAKKKKSTIIKLCSL